MPFVRIDLVEGTSTEFRHGVADVIYDAMRETLNVPEDDRFQVIAEHRLENFIIARTYLGIEHSERCAVVSVTLNEGRSVEMKQAFYRAVADGLHALGLRREDVVISLTEVKKENWSFGNGEAQYA